ncbi:MAG: hypothetical protein ABIK31_07485 [candidate division WOR-3 bacterium]
MRDTVKLIKGIFVFIGFLLLIRYVFIPVLRPFGNIGAILLVVIMLGLAYKISADDYEP